MSKYHKINWLPCISLIYLCIPFLIFAVTFLRAWISIPLILLLLWTVFNYISAQKSSDVNTKPTIKELVPGLIVIFIWVLLSGIGGYAFQNPDFHARNALFQDLINLKWPVIYSGNSWGSPSDQYLLTYYFGFWLPAALIGKIFGSTIANFALFLWALIGVILTVFLLRRILKTSLILCAILLIFFSGMDILTNFLLNLSGYSGYPTLWPPISHLEWTLHIFQFSSFSTQLFWVFNQAIPCWVTLLLLFVCKSYRFYVFIWSICFFFAPLPALGMLPILLILMFTRYQNPVKNFTEKPFSPDKLVKNGGFIRIIFSLENIFGGGLIFFVSFALFRSNSQALPISFLQPTPEYLFFYFLFIMFEFLIMWFILSDSYKRDPLWIVIGIIMVISPWISMGGLQGFCMRASIPAQMILMIWVGKSLLLGRSFKYHIILICILILGSFTPLYEINRSIYRTANFWLLRFQKNEEEDIAPEVTKNLSLPQFDMIPENDHPKTLWAMDYASLSNFDLEQYTLYVTNIKNSLFAQLLMRR